MTRRRPRTPAERMRAYRDRRKMGLVSMRIAIDPAVLDVLVRAGKLTPEYLADPDALAVQIAFVVEDAIGNVTS